LGKFDFDDYDMREWLLQCYNFDQAKEFALLTKRLAYGVAAYVTESNPTNYSHLCLTTHIIGTYSLKIIFPSLFSNASTLSRLILSLIWSQVLSTQPKELSETSSSAASVVHLVISQRRAAIAEVKPELKHF